MAGHLDWEHIVDRTRSPRGNSHWTSPAQIIRGAAYSYARDKWANQPARVEVWVEKEALAGVVQRAASAMDCSYFSCRGYVSQSAMWRAARRIAGHLSDGRTERVVVLHLGDHDPSGMDMTRDIRERLGHFIGVDYSREQMVELYGGTDLDDHQRETLMADVDHYMNRLEVRRIALNTPQIQEYDPPPNPAKLTDARAAGYVERYGYESWELDALPPDALDELIRDEITEVMDPELYAAEEAQEQAERDRLLELARTWT